MKYEVTKNSVVMNCMEVADNSLVPTHKITATQVALKNIFSRPY